jgi:hypothetical protein
MNHCVNFERSVSLTFMQNFVSSRSATFLKDNSQRFAIYLSQLLLLLLLRSYFVLLKFQLHIE